MTSPHQPGSDPAAPSGIAPSAAAAQDPTGSTTEPLAVREPPRRLGGILAALGPGLIIAGSIVGSGELIATTKTGAQAGIALLWLIIVGCLIKVFVQIELGRYAISEGEPTLSALNRVPGPRLGVNWLIWYWAAMMIASMGQLGGIVGGVGQSLAMTIPITGDYIAAVRLPSSKQLQQFVEREKAWAAQPLTAEQQASPDQVRARRGHEKLAAQLKNLGERGEQLLTAARAGQLTADPKTMDERLWAVLVAIITAVLLFRGGYDFIQNASTVLVVAFTFVTVGNVISLQRTEMWAIPMADIVRGLSFGLPEGAGGLAGITTALATFGIIGVGATELIAYPYWCLEKGYGRFAGPRSPDQAWVTRAKGWINVMHWDAFASMIVYTVATLAFYLMGVAVLHNEGLDPDGMRMVSTLSEAYVPVFGEYARWLFLLGAFAVLYSTYLVASAGHSRTVVDFGRLIGWLPPGETAIHQRALAWISGAFPLICLAMYLTIGDNPVTLILWSGLMQAVMLPMLAGAALYFRYCRTDARLRPGPLWDVFLAVSSLGLLIAGVWTIVSKLS